MPRSSNDQYSVGLDAVKQLVSILHNNKVPENAVVHLYLVVGYSMCMTKNI